MPHPAPVTKNGRAPRALACLAIGEAGGLAGLEDGGHERLHCGAVDRVVGHRRVQRIVKREAVPLHVAREVHLRMCTPLIKQGLPRL